jgi:hypothetical protein
MLLCGCNDRLVVWCSRQSATLVLNPASVRMVLAAWCWQFGMKGAAWDLAGLGWGGGRLTVSCDVLVCWGIAAILLCDILE